VGGARLADLLQHAIASRGDPELDFARDVEPWLGRTAAVWMPASQPAGGGEDARGLALVATTDAELTREKVAAALRRSGRGALGRSSRGADPATRAHGEQLGRLLGLERLGAYSGAFIADGDMLAVDSNADARATRPSAGWPSSAAGRSRRSSASSRPAPGRPSACRWCRSSARPGSRARSG
jgi:hypothetical protein